jgi:glycosyltransferase involved in cell wall biosynthesis
MHVLMLADHLGHPDGKVHGGTTYYVNTYGQLKKMGIEVTAAFLGQPHSASVQLKKMGVEPIFFSRSKWDPRALLDARKLMRDIRPDLLHLHTEKSLIIGRLLGLSMKIPCIVHLHNTNPLKVGVAQLLRMLAPHTSRVLIVSENLRDYAVHEHGFANTIVQSLPNGLDLSKFNLEEKEKESVRSKLLAELGLGSDQVLVSVIGRVNEVKGQYKALEAMPYVLNKTPNVKLLVVGDGPDIDRCKAISEDSCLQNKVLFLGQREDIPGILYSSSIVLVPSMWEEPFGYVALEAAAAGVPVIAFSSGALPNLVLDRVSGLVVDKGNVEALANAIIEVVSKPDLRQFLCERAKEHARNFSIEEHVSHLLSVYYTVLEDGGSFR